jgi:putative holliday junction resolvase
VSEAKQYSLLTISDRSLHQGITIPVVAVTIVFPYNTTHMRLMGIDYGTKKVGLAFTDEGGQMAFPHSVVQNTPKLLDVIIGFIAEKKVAEIVIGHSLDKEGKPNAVHGAVEALMLDLTLATGLPIHLEPEQYSTQAAIQLQGRNAETDASAAALILDGYLTRKK